LENMKVAKKQAGAIVVGQKERASDVLGLRASALESFSY